MLYGAKYFIEIFNRDVTDFFWKILNKKGRCSLCLHSITLYSKILESLFNLVINIYMHTTRHTRSYKL